MCNWTTKTNQIKITICTPNNMARVVHHHVMLLARISLTLSLSSHSIAVCTFASLILMSFSVNETLFPRYVYLSTDCREPPFRVEMSPSRLKHMYSIFFIFTWRPMPPAACSKVDFCIRIHQCWPTSKD